MERTLDLVLTFHWFDMIAGGKKKYEYREATPYWDRRFIKSGCRGYICVIKHYDFVRFHRGYSNDTMLFSIKNIDLIYDGTIPDLYLHHKDYYAIELGERIA